MNDQTNAHDEALDEMADRDFAILSELERAYSAGNVEWDELREARFEFRYGQRRWFGAQIARGQGKVHRVYARSAKFLDTPHCGSSRWTMSGGRNQARATTKPVDCQKCLR